MSDLYYITLGEYNAIVEETIILFSRQQKTRQLDTISLQLSHLSCLLILALHRAEAEDFTEERCKWTQIYLISLYLFSDFHKTCISWPSLQFIQTQAKAILMQLSSRIH